MEEEADDEDIWTSNAMRRMYTDDVISEEMHNPIDPFGLKEQAASTLKRMTWLSDTNGQTSKFNKRERGETSQGRNLQRVEEFSESDDTEPAEDGNKEVGGAVGSEPPLPP
ncbi:hypothetical protein Bca4012_030891 [Brassica carinata]